MLVVVTMLCILVSVAKAKDAKKCAQMNQGTQPV